MAREAKGGPAVPPDKKLVLRFHGRVLEHLGLQIYQSPVNSIAELVANSWDADAEKVDIVLPASLKGAPELVMRDDGDGMTFQECQERYLAVGWNRRKEDPNQTTGKGRPVLGRKGIGKFAGFGIAKLIKVDTTSAANGERTVFQLDLDNLLGEEYVQTSDKEVKLIEYEPPDDARKRHKGTVVTLSRLTLERRLNRNQYARSMSRRFLLQQLVDDFVVRVNGKKIPEAFDLSKVQYAFPRDYTDDGRPAGLTVEAVGSWGVEKLSNGMEIRWRVLFFDDTIDEPELQGVAVFANGKVCQTPFLFNLAGGLGGQHGVQYMAGQVVANHLDSMKDDIIATERQRVRWEHPEAAPLIEWGQKRIKQLLEIWRHRRVEGKVQMLEKKIARFSSRLEKLGKRESKVIRRAILKVAEIPTLTDQRFEELAEDMLTSWEHGRLHDLIEELSEGEAPPTDVFLEVLAEAQVLSALNVAEAVKTKLLVVGGLKKLVKAKELELAVRDYIAEHPWLVAPDFETFRVEKSVDKLLDDSRKKAGMVGGDWEGRIDLALSSGRELVVLEFMRPKLGIDWEHVQRFERYVRIVRSNIEANTGGRFHFVTGYIVADALERRAEIVQKIEAMERDRMFAMDWDTLIAKAKAQWQEFLDILAERAPEDERIKALLEQ